MGMHDPSASSADIQDDNLTPAGSSDAATGDNPATSPIADGTEAQPGADQVHDQNDTGQGTDAKQKDERADLLATVRKALAKDRPADPEGASSDPGGKQDGEGEPAQGDGKKAADKDGDDARFDKHPRFQELRAQVQQYRPKAEQFDRIQEFMAAHDLTPAEVGEGLKIMGMMKRDPAKAYEALRPIVERLGRFTGDRLPDDLAERVDAGEISEAAARELATLRASREHSAVMLERDRQRAQERQAAELSSRMESAANEWAALKMRSDPDFAAIERLVHDRGKVIVDYLVSQGRPPRTPEEAIAICEQAYKDVMSSLKPLRSQKPGIRHVPSSGSTSTNAQSQPKSSLDAARQGLYRARAARG